MPKRTERAYGAIPEWAKTGMITLRNYPYRAELHCFERSGERKGTHPTVKLENPEGKLWRQYFEVHLGGLPHCMVMLITERIIEMTVPEPVPMWFDPSFEPDPKYVSPEYVEPRFPGRYWPPIPEGQDYETMLRQYGAPVGRRG